jgi:uncharacterized repeat protein (TIGR03803 family)
MLTVAALSLTATTSALAQGVTLLYSFGMGGRNPAANLLFGSDGNFYGTTQKGGTNSVGTVFKLTSDGTYSTLANFATSNGSTPMSSLIEDTSGNLYGSTLLGGGTRKRGSIFRVTKAGVLTTLHGFDTRDDDGNDLYGGLVLDANGNLYGTASTGGQDKGGTVFKRSTNGTLTVLHRFSNLDHSDPRGNLAWDHDGNLYGTTYAGNGSVFRVNSDSSFDLLHSFNGANGSKPYAGVTMGPDGNFYGTTESGGANNMGTIYRITPLGGHTLLYSFDGATGRAPLAGLTLASDGNFYGSTSAGGANGKGTLFQIHPSGGFNILYSFSGPEGETPYASLTEDDSGNLFGTTYAGGANGHGAFFTVTKARSYVYISPRRCGLGKHVTFRASCYRGGIYSRLAGKSVTFRLGGTEIGTALTNSLGLAEVTYTLPDTLSLGNHTITAEFGGDLIFMPSNGSNTLNVGKSDVSINVGARQGQAGQTILFRAALNYASGIPYSPIAGRTLTFRIGSTTLGSAVTGANGLAELSAPIPALLPGNHTITVQFAGDDEYHAATGSNTLTVLP